MATTHDLPRAALTYAERGWPVFPIRPDTKLPMTRHGLKDATTDPERIRFWWRRVPSANIAVATGYPAVDVLDVDQRPGGSGFPALERLRRAGLLAGALAIVRTPSGGLHLYYVGTGQRSARLHRCFLDLKGAGGYVLVPPSMVDGRPYTWVEQREGGRPLDWAAVVALLEPPRPARPRCRTWQGTSARYLIRWLAQQEEGNRNAALFWAACCAFSQGASAAELEALAATAIHLGLTEHEVRATIGSAARTVGVAP